MTDATLPALSTQADTRPDRRWLRLWAYLTRPLRHAWRARTHRLTPEEIAARDKARAAAAHQRAIEKQLDELAVHYKRLISNALTRVGAARLTKEDGKQVIRPVKFYKTAQVTTEAIYIRVDTNHLPWRVKLNDLYDPINVETLSASCERVVEAIWDRNAPENGFWYAVWLKQGVRGIPRRVEYAPMLADMPKTASRFTVPVGRGVAKRPVFLDFVNTPHLLIAGATGGGKTVCIEQIILTLAMQNTPAQMQLWLIDLKDGTDLSQFKTLPHLIGHKVTRDVENVVGILESALHEIKRRSHMFEEHEVINIDGWNQRQRRKLPRLFIIIDELAEVMLSDKKKEAERVLARIAALGRSAGVHAIIATQRPDSNIVTGLIKANFTNRFAFGCSDQRQSMVILDTGEAAHLEPVGRMIYMHGAYKSELQSPFVSPEIIGETVAIITQGKPADALAARRRHNLSPEDFFRHAIDRYPGKFPIRPIYEDLKKDGVTEKELRDLARRLEGKEFEIDGETFTLTGAVVNGVKESRQLIRLRPRIPDTDDGDAANAETMGDDGLAEFQPIVIPTETAMVTMHDAEQADLNTDPSADEEPDPDTISTEIPA